MNSISLLAEACNHFGFTRTSTASASADNSSYNGISNDTITTIDAPIVDGNNNNYDLKNCSNSNNNSSSTDHRIDTSDGEQQLLIDTNVESVSGPPTAQSTTLRTTRGNWSPAEDELLRKAVQQYGGRNWKKISELIADRTDVQCLHRWQKVLRPGLIKGPWSSEVKNYYNVF